METAASPRTEASPASTRLCAHFLDLCVVQGFSVTVAKVSSALLVSVHMQSTELSAKAADSTFLDGFEYANGYLLAAGFAAIGTVYFVGLPILFGRTLGLGLFGLKIAGDGGKVPDPNQILLRVLGCMLNFASGGIACLMGLRQRDGRFLQDRLSGTRVVRN